MYFPYFRGRQFELIAIKELLEEGLIGDKIVPVVEPVKLTSTLAAALAKYIDKKHDIALVMNPEVGEFVPKIKELGRDDKVVNSIYRSIESEHLIRAYIIKSTISEKVKSLKLNSDDYMIICPSRNCLDNYLSVFASNEPRYTLVPGDRAFFRKVGNSKIIFEDRFVKAKKNADYMKEPDQFFSEDHLYFAEEGCTGFSDYSIVGEEYTESGFAPTAVAIHIVYFSKNMELRIRHFVSDTNTDYNDPAKKFGEALEKLVYWLGANDIPSTKGLRELVNCYEEGRYPGLGSVKKYSMMHHLELMNLFLEGKIK